MRTAAEQTPRLARLDPQLLEAPDFAALVEGFTAQSLEVEDAAVAAAADKLADILARRPK